MEYLFSLSGVLTALALGAISPGPSFVMVARTSVASSRGNGIAAAIGMGAGSVIFSLLVLFGLQAVLQAHPWLYMALKTAGALYLIYIGVRIWRAAKARFLESDVGTTKANIRHSFLCALLTQLSNPKAAVLYGSIFAALLPRELPPEGFWVLPCLVFLIEAGWYTVVALALSPAPTRRAYLRCKTALDRVTGGVMGFLGVKLLLGARCAG